MDMRDTLSSSGGSSALRTLPKVGDVQEAKLVTSARRGDVQAFTDLIGPLQESVWRLGMRITGNRQDAEEVVQESLMKAWKNVQRFRGDSRFSTWLFRIAFNEARMKLRRRSCQPQFISCEARVDDQYSAHIRELRDRRANPEELLLQEEQGFQLMEAMQNLHPALRRVFVLRYIYGFSTCETCMALKLSAPAAKAQAFRARKRMKSELTKMFAAEQPRFGHDCR